MRADRRFARLNIGEAEYILKNLLTHSRYADIISVSKPIAVSRPTDSGIGHRRKDHCAGIRGKGLPSGSKARRVDFITAEDYRLKNNERSVGL